MTELAPGEAKAVATTVVEMACGGRFSEIEQVVASPARGILSAETVRNAWATVIGTNGQVSTVGEPMAEPAKEGLVRVRVPHG